MTPPRKPSVPLNTFIIRLWREVESDQVNWRGRVQHVQSGEQAAFTDEAGLLNFIRHWVKMPERERKRREVQNGTQKVHSTSAIPTQGE